MGWSSGLDGGRGEEGAWGSGKAGGKEEGMSRYGMFGRNGFSAAARAAARRGRGGAGADGKAGAMAGFASGVTGSGVGAGGSEGAARCKQWHVWVRRGGEEEEREIEGGASREGEGDKTGGGGEKGHDGTADHRANERAIEEESVRVSGDVSEEASGSMSEEMSGKAGQQGHEVPAEGRGRFQEGAGQEEVEGAVGDEAGRRAGGNESGDAKMACEGSSRGSSKERAGSCESTKVLESGSESSVDELGGHACNVEITRSIKGVEEQNSTLKRSSSARQDGGEGGATDSAKQRKLQGKLRMEWRPLYEKQRQIVPCFVSGRMGADRQRGHGASGLVSEAAPVL